LYVGLITTTSTTTSTTTTSTTTTRKVMNADVVEGSSCSGDDCYSVASCPSGTSVLECTSEPVNGGDGIQVESSKCIARGGNNRRRVKSIRAVAVCSSQKTSVAISSSMYLDNQLVSASCLTGYVLSCNCHSAWTSSVCGGVTAFDPIRSREHGTVCEREIGSSTGHRRRGVGGGAGARVYAVCSAGVKEDVQTVWGTSCSGNDCSSHASCPTGSYLIECASIPANSGDGIQVGNGKCTARGSASGSIRAVAVCSSLQSTSVSVSSNMYLDSEKKHALRKVSASCSSGKVLSCYCHSPWTASVCGGSTQFSPLSSTTCQALIGASGGRRRMTGIGAGAKVYALCDA